MAQPELSFLTRTLEKDADPGLDFAARYLLDELGVELEEPENDELDSFLAPFGVAFQYARVLDSCEKFFTGDFGFRG